MQGLRKMYILKTGLLRESGETELSFHGYRPTMILNRFFGPVLF